MPKKLAIITGASSGIGFSLARVFAENGFDLIINSEDERLESAAAELRNFGAQVTPSQADLATYDGVEKFWQGIEELSRKVDAAAINAGVGVGGKFAETDLDEEINLVRLNVEGTVHITKRVVQHMVRNGQGRILITSSIAGEMVAPREAVYAASKAFDLSFAKSIREELDGTGVSVTALQPGPTDTEFFDRAGLANTKVGSEGKKENSPYEVAKQGFEALMKGEQHIYAGNTKLKLEGATANIMPDSVQAAMHEKMARPKDEKVA